MTLMMKILTLVHLHLPLPLQLKLVAGVNFCITFVYGSLIFLLFALFKFVPVFTIIVSLILIITVHVFIVCDSNNHTCTCMENVYCVPCVLKYIHFMNTSIHCHMSSTAMPNMVLLY